MHSQNKAVPGIHLGVNTYIFWVKKNEWIKLPFFKTLYTTGRRKKNEMTLFSSASCEIKHLWNFLLVLEVTFCISHCFLFKYIDIRILMWKKALFLLWSTTFSYNKFFSIGFFSTGIFYYSLCQPSCTFLHFFFFFFFLCFFLGLVIMKLEWLLPCPHQGKELAT